MFRITEDPSSANLVYRTWLKLQKKKKDSIVSVDMDVFGVMAA